MTSAPPVSSNLRLTAPYRPLWWPRRILGESGLFGEWLATNNLSVAIKLSARGAGQWVAHCQVDSADRHERAAAMWAAATWAARVAGHAAHMARPHQR